MCDLTEGVGTYEGLNTTVFGISGDSPFALEAWANEEKIRIPLLSDYDHSVARAFGVAYDSFLPEGDVTVAVDYSTLNYKDGLAITNKSPVVRTWPMVAGIDGAGSVLESSAPGWKAGCPCANAGGRRTGCVSSRSGTLGWPS